MSGRQLEAGRQRPIRVVIAKAGFDGHQTRNRRLLAARESTLDSKAGSNFAVAGGPVLVQI